MSLRKYYIQLADSEQLLIPLQPNVCKAENSLLSHLSMVDRNVEMGVVKEGELLVNSIHLTAKKKLQLIIKDNARVFQWLYLLEGVLNRTIPGDNNHLVPAKMVLVSSPASPDQIFGLEPNMPYSIFLVHFPLTALEGWLHLRDIESLLPILSDPDAIYNINKLVLPIAFSQYETLKSIVSGPFSNGLAAEQLPISLGWLLATSLEQATYVASEETARNTHFQQTDRERVFKIVERLMKTLDQPLDIDLITRATGLNATRLQVLFKAVFGITVMQFFMKLRLEKSRELLSETELPVHSIAMAVGFSNTAHFSSVFGKKHGISPRAYRKLHALHGSSLFEKHAE
jgi:AraC-like DNA-binding protein